LFSWLRFRNPSRIDRRRALRQIAEIERLGYSSTLAMPWR
jgi:hypothetical protein